MEFCLLTEEEYAKFWASHPQRNFSNAPEAMKLHEMKHEEVAYPAVKENGRILCATPLFSLPVMRIYRAYFAKRGFLIDYKDTELLKFFTKEIRAYAKKRKGLYVEADPYILYKERDNDGRLVPNGFDNSYVLTNMEKAGFYHKKFIRTYDGGDVKWMFSLYINGRTGDEILAEMRGDTRRSINKLERTGVRVRELGRDEMDIFINMMKETSGRLNFTMRDERFYSMMRDAYGDHMKMLVVYLDVKESLAKLDRDQAELEKNLAETDAYLANPDGPTKSAKKKKKQIENDLKQNRDRRSEMLALQKKHGDIVNMASAMFTIYDSEITYLFSGTFDEYRKYNAAYATQWYMIKYAIDHHISRYNFYGFSGGTEEGSIDYGLYEFKKGFGAVVEQLVGEFILPVRPGMYALYRKLKKMPKLEDACGNEEV